MQNYLTHKLEEEGLFQSRFPDGGFVVWRPLAWSEYRKLREARAIVGPSIDSQIEEITFNKCVLYSSYDTPPPNSLPEEEIPQWIADCRADQPAGIISTIVKSIMFMSGAFSAETIIDQLDQHRSVVSNIEDQLIALVCKAFPAYKPEEVEALPWQTLLKRVAQAEQILGSQVSLMKPKEPEKFDLAKDMKELGREFKPTMTQENTKEIFEEKQKHRSEVTKLRQQYLNERGFR